MLPRNRSLRLQRKAEQASENKGHSITSNRLTPREKTKKKKIFDYKFYLRVFLLFIYKTGLMIEKCVSYANREGVGRFIDYVSTVSIVLWKLIKKYSVKLYGWLRGTSRYWVPVCAVFIVIGVIYSSTFYAVALKVTVNDDVVGYVESQDQYEQAKDKVEDDITNQVGDSFLFDSLPVFSYSIVKKDKLSDSKIIYSTLKQKAEENLGQTYGLFVDGELIGSYSKEGPLLDMLDELKNPYVAGAKDETIEFVKKVEIQRSMYPKSSLRSLEELKLLFTQPRDDDKYTVKSGDSLNSISKKFDLSSTRLKMLNGDKELSKLKIGQTLSVAKPQIDLGIKAVRTIYYSESIKYSETSQKTTDLFEGSVKVKVKGVNGQNDITAKVTLIDGAEKGREIIEKKTVKQPVTQQLLVGSKRIAPSGKFMWPLNSYRRVSSYYGYRGREFHPAIDIPCPRGTPVVASDAGVIIYARYTGGYGYLITIDHGNNVTTKYGHLSSIKVKLGQKVYQGQVIAASGSTGRSTGPHLHFELTNQSGNTINPLNYLP